MGFIGRSWRGEEKLWKVFWLYGVLLGCVLQWGLNKLSEYGDNAAIVALAIYVLYALWQFIATWRCAFNANWRIWGYFLRLCEIFTVLLLIFWGLAASGVVATPYGAKWMQQLYGALEVAAKAPECAKMFEEKAKQQGIDTKEYIKSHRNEFEKCVGSLALSNNAIDAKTEAVCRQNIAENAAAEGVTVDQYMGSNPAEFDACAIDLAARARQVMERMSPCRDSMTGAAQAQGVDVNTYLHSHKNEFAACLGVSAGPAVKQALKSCVKQMSVHATQNGWDPKTYVTQNFGWIQQCIQQATGGVQ